MVKERKWLSSKISEAWCAAPNGVPTDRSLEEKLEEQECHQSLEKGRFLLSEVASLHMGLFSCTIDVTVTRKK